MTRAERIASHRWVRPFSELLRQGVSPEKIALTIALGTMLGVTPVLGSTVLLCTAAAIAFRLNLPAIQVVNGLVYPLQLILLIPFYRLGAKIFGASASTISLQAVREAIRLGAWHTIRMLWVVTLHALVAWLVIGAVASTVLYAALVPVMHRLWRKSKQKRMPA